MKADFVEYVAGKRDWFTQPSVKNYDKNHLTFVFYIAPSTLIEDGVDQKVHDKFQNLKYGVAETLLEVKSKIPREIYDAGLVVVPGKYDSDISKRIMEAGIANMLEAIEEYRGRFSI